MEGLLERVRIDHTPADLIVVDEFDRLSIGRLRIAMLRAERGISRRELAEALGVHYQTVGYLERGEYSPSLHLALRLAAYFEVTVEVIFSTTPFPRLGSAAESA